MSVLPPGRSVPRYHGRSVSREEYLDLEDDGFHYEMIGGVQVEFAVELGLFLRTWPVDPRDRVVHLWLNRGEAWEKRSSVAGSGDAPLESELLAGFSIDPAGLFA